KIFESKEELEPFRGILKRLEGFMQDNQGEKALDCLLSLNTPKTSIRINPSARRNPEALVECLIEGMEKYCDDLAYNRKHNPNILQSYTFCIGSFRKRISDAIKEFKGRYSTIGLY
ncbi:MAG: hypothetical protein AABX71_01795, partial [Nanoarchaeota archaeon]